jgi:hypothetical protein
VDANRMIPSIAVIGPPIDLAFNDLIELRAERVLLRRDARDEGSGAESRPPSDPRTAPAINRSETPRLARQPAPGNLTLKFDWRGPASQFGQFPVEPVRQPFSLPLDLVALQVWTSRRSRRRASRRLLHK